MCRTILLTLGQARSLQELTPDEWPGEYDFLLTTPVPDNPDGELDKARVNAALKLMDLNWNNDQIALQLNWHTKAVREARAIWKYHRENS